LEKIALKAGDNFVKELYGLGKRVRFANLFAGAFDVVTWL